MFNKYRFPKFRPYLAEIMSDKCSCGGHILAVLTGIPLTHIHTLHPANDDWSTEWVMGFLALAGFHCFKVPNNFIELKKRWCRSFYKDHVILAVIGLDHKESSWAVIYRDKIYHGGNIFKGLTTGEVLVNCPIEDMWLVYPASKAKRKEIFQKPKR